MTTFQEFLEAANHCFVRKNSLLASSYKTGYPEYSQLFNQISISGAYLYMLPLLGNNYALTPSEVEKVMYHIMKMCKINMALPSGIDVITGTPCGGIVIDTGNGGSSGGSNYIPQVYVQSYYGTESFHIIVNHSLDKISPTVIVSDTSGSTRVRVYPSITEINSNSLRLDFNSTSSGIITVV